MTTEERRAEVLRRLQAATSPLTGTRLSRELGVSRQIIVGDVSILRAEGAKIFATPRGYILPEDEPSQQKVTLVCQHSAEDMEAELNAIVIRSMARLRAICFWRAAGMSRISSPR